MNGKKSTELSDESNYEISPRTRDAPLVLKNIEDLSKIIALAVTVTTAMQQITDNIGTQLARQRKKLSSNCTTHAQATRADFTSLFSNQMFSKKLAVPSYEYSA